MLAPVPRRLRLQALLTLLAAGCSYNCCAHAHAELHAAGTPLPAADSASGRHSPRRGQASSWEWLLEHGVANHSFCPRNGSVRVRGSASAASAAAGATATRAAAAGQGPAAAVRPGDAAPLGYFFRGYNDT